MLALYEPVLLFHPAEDWAPQNVDSYLSVARVERQTTAATWSPVPAPTPTSNLGCLFNPCFRLNLPCALRSGYACYHQQAIRQTDWSNPVIYATAVPVPANIAPPPGQTKRPGLAAPLLVVLCRRRLALTPQPSLANTRRRLGKHHSRPGRIPEALVCCLQRALLGNRFSLARRDSPWRHPPRCLRRTRLSRRTGSAAPHPTHASLNAFRAG